MLIETSSGKTAGFAQRVESLAQSIESRPGLILVLMSALFLFRFVAFDFRPFWYDEYFTLAVSRLNSFGEIWSALKAGLDLNPPMSYWLTHLSLFVFGQNELAARLPATLGFLAFSFFAYAFVARRSGKLAGLNAALLILATAPVAIVGEARPYGVMLAFAGLAFFSWQSACAGIRRRLYLPLTALSLCAALLCHCYAVLLLVSFAGAELARSLFRKKLDWAVAASILAAVPAVATYLPVLAAARRFVPGSVFINDWSLIPRTYAFTLHDGWGYIALIALLPLFLPRTTDFSLCPADTAILPLHETILLILLSATAIFGVLIARIMQSPWSERYALVGIFGICALLAEALHAHPRHRISELIILFTLLGGFFLQNQQPKYQLQAELSLRQLTLLPKEGLDASKPFVISNGILMKHADTYESPDRLKNVYYLLDRAASRQYTGAEIFDRHFRLFEQYGALRSHLAEYSEFVSAHKSFYLYGPLDYTDDWLIPKLTAGGAAIRVLRRSYFPPNPETEKWIHDAFLCEVTMPAAEDTRR